jgi:uncharacterized RDD family membrane protein YckC
MIDEHGIVQTPEGADLSLPLAGPLPRAVAWIIDALIRGVGYIVLAIVLSLVNLGGLGMGIFFICAFVLEWWYPVLFEAYRQGQTPGKKSMGLAVVHGDGTPASFNACLLRNLLRVADFFPLFYLTGFVTMLVAPRFQRLGDLAADTLVVHVPGRAAQPEVPETVVDARVVPDWPLTLADQQTLLGLAERAQRLTEARRRELAVQAFPERTPAEAERHLMALAHRLLGDA